MPPEALLATVVGLPHWLPGLASANGPTATMPGRGESVVLSGIPNFFLGTRSSVPGTCEFFSVQEFSTVASELAPGAEREKAR